MALRFRYWLAAALGLWMVHPLLAQPPGYGAFPPGQMFQPQPYVQYPFVAAPAVMPAQAMAQGQPWMGPQPQPQPNGTNGPVAEPMPIYQGGPGPADLNPPKMPPYAWPTYAPYNNYSRVAYPTAYPYNAWPFIGPIYPFPKVPLGWRSVKLEFEDGYWWFSKTASKYDWWHLRYR